MIEVVELTKVYGNKTVLEGISFEVSAGSIFSMLGPNGAGKSTAIKILSTCLSFDTGKVQIAGLDVARQAKEVRKNIAVSGQYTSLDEQLSGQENLELFARLIGIRRTQARGLALEQLARFGLEEAANLQVSSYSGGMKRRLDLAIALLVPPKVLFLDEPTTGLDPRSRSDLWSMIRELKQQEVTVVLTTQYLEEADQLADQVLLINQGQIKAEGSPAALKLQYGQLSCAVHPLYVEKLDNLRELLTPFGETRIDAANAATVVTLKQGMESMVGIVREIDKAGIQIADINVFRPSLDDVFHHLVESDSGSPLVTNITTDIGLPKMATKEVELS